MLKLCSESNISHSMINFEFYKFMTKRVRILFKNLKFYFLDLHFINS